MKKERQRKPKQGLHDDGYRPAHVKTRSIRVYPKGGSVADRIASMGTDREVVAAVAQVEASEASDKTIRKVRKAAMKRLNELKEFRNACLGYV